MWNNRPAEKQVVCIGNAEEMDVRLSPRELNDFFMWTTGSKSYSAELLSGKYSLEPFVRIRMAEDWEVEIGVEVMNDEDQA